MIYTKATPVGVDEIIQRKQIELYDSLRTTWGLSENDYLSYGRCYRNQTNEGFVPQMYVGSKEYKDLFIDDNYAVTSFFGVDRIEIVDSVILRGSCHLIMFVDLARVYPSITWRADEEVHQDVYEVMRNDSAMLLKERWVGIDNVFREYNAWRDKSKGINNRDMQPLHCFRLNFDLNYFTSSCSFQIN